MTHCAKCGAELIGARRFCTACGTPTVDPRAPTGSHALPAGAPKKLDGSDAAYGSPVPSQVNPFAQTAMPTDSMRSSDYGPPPQPAPRPSAVPGPAASFGSAVSPLAVSNVMSHDDVLPSARRVPSRPAPAGNVAGVALPGTQAMPASAAPHIKERTALMSAVPLSQPPSAPQPQYAQAQAYAAQPRVQGPSAQPYPGQQQGSSARGAQPNGPVSQAPGFAPGARVLVLWADGRRYPGTVHQINATMHLVVFPDGQQHWVDLPYLIPG